MRQTKQRKERKVILNRESGAATAKSRAAPATVREECKSECHWETGKVDLHDDTQARRPALLFLSTPSGKTEKTGDENAH